MLLVALLGLISCNIKEDVSDCPGSMILDYSAYSDEILDEIGSEEQIDVFIFDPTGICVEIYTFTYGELEAQGFEFVVPIEYRNYNAVVWQGLNSESYTSNRMVLCESYENFYTRLVYEAATLSYSKVPESLWATQLEPIEFCAKITRHRVYMTRLHTKVEVNLYQKYSDGSVEELDMEDYLVTIEAQNNVYHTDYTIDKTESVELDYDNKVEVESGQDLRCACVGTLRIAPDMNCVLYVEPKGSTQRTITIGGASEIDLVNYMLATKTDSEISDQEFLDLNKVWDIDLVLEANDTGYVAVMLSINGWVVWFSSSDLS